MINTNIKERDIVKVKITGIQEYGAFALIDNTYNGLIHISEISYGFVKNINDYLNVGDIVYAEVIEFNPINKQVKLSIKDVDYKNSGHKLERLAETRKGFKPLSDNLEKWINQKIKEITDKF